MSMFRSLCRLLWNCGRVIESFWWCFRARLKFDPTWRIAGRLYVVRPPFYHKQPEIRIGRNFTALSRFTSNSLGLIQPVLLHAEIGAKLIMGDGVGLSGCSVFTAGEVTIGDRVLVGSGSIITDSDAHPLLAEERNDSSKIKVRPVHIGNDVFIGARCIILKGVTIGDGAVIGAGSVVSRDIPPCTVYAGNPAQFIKKLPEK